MRHTKHKPSRLKGIVICLGNIRTSTSDFAGRRRSSFQLLGSEL